MSSTVRVAPAGAWLEVSRAARYAGQPLQWAVMHHDGNGSGHGTRLAGPKFGSSGSELLGRIRVTRELVVELAKSAGVELAS